MKSYNVIVNKHVDSDPNQSNGSEKKNIIQSIKSNFEQLKNLDPESPEFNELFKLNNHLIYDILVK